jgi:YaiO family outer membrane protein
MTPIIIALFPLLLAQNEVGTDSISKALPAIYEEFTSGDSLSYNDLFTLAQQLAHSNFWEEAIEVCSALLINNPDDPDARLGRGLVYAWQGRFEEAVDDLANVTERYPSYSDAWMALGNAYFWWDKPDQAVDAYSRAVDLLPDSATPLIVRAKAYQRLRAFPKARADLFRAQVLGGSQEEIGQLLRDIDRIPSPLKWEPVLLLEIDTFSRKYSNWSIATIAVKRELTSGSIALGKVQVDRFDKQDAGFLIDGYFNLWRRAYGNLRIQISPDHRVLPKTDATTEIFQGFGRGWEISGSYRQMSFTEVTARIYGVSLAKFAGQWYLRSQLLAVPKDQGTDSFAKAMVRRYLWTADSFFEIGAGAGREVIPGVEEPMYISTYLLVAKGQIFFNRRIGMAFAGSFQRADEYDRGGFSVGIITRF